MKIRKLTCAVVGVSCVSLVPVGCGPKADSGSSMQQVAAGPAVAVTSMDVYLRGPDFQYARWHVEADGTLKFAGGRAARSSDWSWSGRLTPSQAAAIDAVAAQWVVGSPRADEATANVWEVQWGDGQRFTVHGDATSIDAAWSVFNEAGAARFKAELDRVPDADLNKYMQSREAAVEVE